MVSQVLKSLIKFLRAKNVALGFLLVFTLAPVFAIDPVTVSVDSETIGINQTVSINFTVTQSGISDLNFPTSTADYNAVASSTSSSIQIINGKLSQNKTFSYVLKPLHEGVLSIPALSYTYANQAYQTQPIQITVTAAVVPPSMPRPSSPRNTAPRPAPVASAPVDMDPIVENKASNYSPYLNQQFLIKTKIYHRGNLKGLSLAALQIDHVNIKRLDHAKEFTEVKNGLEYMVYEVDYIAFPLKSGAITIPEYDVTATVVRERQRNMGSRIDPFTFMGSMFEEQQLVIKAPAINLNVRALPTNAPPGFSGYVGSLAVNHQVDKLTIDSGEAVTIKSNAYGSGNPKNLDFDFFEESQLYSVYKDKENLNIEINNEYEYFGLNASSAIIPEKRSGRILVKTKALISFNPNTKQFEKHGEDQFEIFVKPVTKLDANGNSIEIEPEASVVPKLKKEEFKKELSIYSINEILSYKSWKNFDTNYLLIFLLLLNAAYFTRFTLRRVKFKVNQERIDIKELRTRIKQATELEEISSIVKDIEKDITVNFELKQKFQDFTNETDRYNYGLMKNFDENKFAELKTRAIALIKELKVNAG